MNDDLILENEPVVDFRKFYFQNVLLCRIVNMFTDRKSILINPYFVGIALVKLLTIVFFLRQVAYTAYFLPSLEGSLSSGWFPTAAIWDIGSGYSEFPYGIAMAICIWPLTKLLWLLNVPGVGIGLTVFVFDVILYLLLVMGFKFPVKKTLLIYWASPILFYVNYIHGQLDILPMTLLLGATVCLMRNAFWKSAIFCGLAVNAKASVLLAIPILGYALYKRRGVKCLLKYSTIFILTVIGLAIPFLENTGYQNTVLRTPEIQRFFSVFISYGNSYELYIAPLVLCLLYFKYFCYTKINNDLMLMYLGLIFAVTIVFITPAPGWYVWPLPFILLYFIKVREQTPMIFALFNILYFVNYALPTGAFVDNPLHKLIFTGLQGCLLILAFQMYFYGVLSNEVYRERKTPFFIGIGGDSAAGKNTFASSIKALLGQKRVLQIDCDDDHKWKRDDENWESYTHLNPKANNLYNLLTHVHMLRCGKKISRRQYDHNSGDFKNPKLLDPNKFVFIQGLHPFYIKRVRNYLDLRIFLKPDDSLRNFWKIRRDMQERGYTKEQVLEAIDRRSVDSDRYIKPQLKHANMVIEIKPLEPLEGKEDDFNYNPKLRLSCCFENSHSMDELYELLKSEGGSKVQLDYDEDMEYQTLHYDGDISGEALSALAVKNIPNADELVADAQCWDGGLLGVVQYITLKVICDHLQVNS